MEKETIKLKSDIDEVLFAFNLKMNKKCALLDELLGKTYELNEIQTILLEQKRQELAQEGDFWNEKELKMNFFAFLFDIAKINEKGKIKLFYERSLSANKSEIDMYFVEGRLE